MSGHCDFCGIWHSASCCHPGRAVVANLESQLTAANAEIDRVLDNQVKIAEVRDKEIERLITQRDLRDLYIAKLEGFESQLTAAKESGLHWFNKLAEAKGEIERLKDTKTNSKEGK